MIAAEEKQFVLEDGAANCAAELIAFQRAACNGEVAPCVEKIVAYKFEKVAVKRIRARFRDRADLSAARLRSGQSADLGFEFR